jgi:hypothetical protein
MSETKKTQGQNAGSCKIELATIFDKKDPSRSVSVAGGFVELRYYESILQDGIQATFMFSDAGNSIDKKTVSEGLPLNGGETFSFKAKDNNETTLEFDMIVGNDMNISSETTKSLVILPLSSKAFAVNDTQNVRKFFPKQKISDHVKTLMTDFLKTEKTLDVEETSNSLKEYGLNRKPYYMLNTFAKKAQPSGGEGQTAGYFFFETSEKMIFKSIDSFFDEDKNPRKRSIIYNQGPEKNQVPEGYDYKALTYDRESASKLEMSKMGAFSTRAISIDPSPKNGGFTFTHNVLSTIEDIVENVDEVIKPLTSAAKELATFNPALIQEFSRTTLNFLDTGSFGQTAEESLENNFDFGGIYNQSIMRYNQVFASKVHILVQGDFELHAGDMIFFDAPSPEEDTKNDEIDKQAGGLYIIASLCHQIKPDKTLTKLCLIRDSFGRQGNHTKR